MFIALLLCVRCYVGTEYKDKGLLGAGDQLCYWKAFTDQPLPPKAVLTDSGVRLRCLALKLFLKFDTQ